ncbi:hypothetical protein HZA85_03065 [Candidatus Uhrbacteria bacterium]|nr:hypothetical protein [Candidatus Uhrbacteria bacterium]
MTNLRIANTAIFLSVAVLHAMRIAYKLPVFVGSIELSLWLSVVAVIGAGVLSWMNWRTIHAPGKTEWLKLLLALFVVDAAIVFYSWVSGLSFWGIANTQFAWILLFDLVVIVLLSWTARKK